MILGVIPARGGSKGILKKNTKIIAGKPLLQWTIEHAKSARLLDHFIVSTEDMEIGRFAEINGVEWWKRPVELATDEASTISVLEDVVSNYKKEITAVVVLQPTSPIRSKALIDRCITCFIDNNLDSLATGFIDKNTEYGKFQHYRRQDYKGRFCDDGNVYVIKADIIKCGDRIGKKFGGLIISKEENMEIDDPLDFAILEYFLNNSLNGGELKGIKRGTKYDFISLPF